MTIRDFEPADQEDLHEILGDPQTMAFSEPPYSPAQTRSFLMDFCIGRRAAQAAALKESGKVIGYLLFKPLGNRMVFQPPILAAGPGLRSRRRLGRLGLPGARRPKNHGGNGRPRQIGGPDAKAGHDAGGARRGGAGLLQPFCSRLATYEKIFIFLKKYSDCLLLFENNYAKI